MKFGLCPSWKKKWCVVAPHYIRAPHGLHTHRTKTQEPLRTPFHLVEEEKRIEKLAWVGFLGVSHTAWSYSFITSCLAF